MKDESQKV